MREVCFLLVEDMILRVYFGSGGAIPDSMSRWEVIWANRQGITEIVHSHPGGYLGFSHEDLTTMEAVESATGRVFRWSVVTEEGYLTREGDHDRARQDSPWWLPLLRRLSFGPGLTASEEVENACAD